MEKKSKNPDMHGWSEDATSMLVYIPINELYSHPDNPRKDLGDLTELADSIKVKGVLQNLTVVRGHAQTKEEWAKYNDMYRENPSEELREKINARWNEDGYTVIIGHRRTAVSKLAGLSMLPCIIAEMTPEEQVTTMMLENMQRSDLTIYEQAKGFQLMLDFGNTVETVAEKSGFSQTTVRRRIKLLELDEDKFKKAETRGATLFEYMELDKIKDMDLKNKVLNFVGTPNFKNELQKAIDKEAKKEYLDFAESEVAKFAKKIDSRDSDYIYKDSWGTWRKVDEIPVPADSEEVEYFYTRDDSYVTLFTKRDVVVEEEEKQKRAEQKEKIERRIDALEEASERAYELRRDFADNLTATDIKKHFAEMVAFWMHREMYKAGYYGIRNMVKKTLGVDTDSEEQMTYDNVVSVVKERPELYLWEMIRINVCDGDYETYFSIYRGEHKNNKKLSDWYNLLERLGYQMSDEEKALRDGTHELFAEEGDA